VLDAKVDVEVDRLHVKRIGIENLVGYVYIVRVDKIKHYLLPNWQSNPSSSRHEIEVKFLLKESTWRTLCKRSMKPLYVSGV
jgi:hypothetical protein